MPNANSTIKKKIVDRRRKVARIFSEGIRNQFAIVDILEERYGIKVDRSTVSLDLKFLNKQWQSEAMQDIDAHKARIKADYEFIYQQAIEGWLASLENKEIQMIKKSEENKDGEGEIQLRTEGQSGNAALLAQAQSALKSIREMLGIDEPSRRELSAPGGGPLVIKEVIVELPHESVQD